jgi:hypothetical protein
MSNNRARRLDYEPVEAEARPFSITKPKTSIMFSRYGLVKESEIPAIQNIFYGFEVPREALFPAGAPAVSGYSYCLKPVRDGYLYVYNETESQ